MTKTKFDTIVICSVFSVLFLSSLMWPVERQPLGNLVIIGGGLTSTNQRVYNTFIDLGGGKDNIRIAIIPAASGTPSDSGKYIVKEFAHYGVPESHIKIFPVAVMDDPSTGDVNESLWGGNGFKKELADEMSGYNAVFFSGGDQARCLKTLKAPDGKDAPLLAAIREIYIKGGVIGGTSAGAAIMSDPMICDGDSMSAWIKGANFNQDSCSSGCGVCLTKGFGFFEHGLTDQHFLKRGRLGRLIFALYYLKGKTMGFGVDEDTAAVYHAKTKTVEVVGNSGMLIVDTGKAVFKMTGNGLKGTDIILHYLEDGDSFNVETGKFFIDNKRKPIEKGKEYYETSLLNTGIFGKDAVKDVITTGLADNRQNEGIGIAFNLEPNGSGKGVKLISRKGPDTLSYYGDIDDNETYSALYIHLDIIPINIKITNDLGE